MDFGVPDFCEHIWCICIKEEEIRFDKEDREILLQLNKKHNYNCYDNKYDPDKNIAQRRGVDWGFYNFKFLKGTPVQKQKDIIENTTPIPVAARIALSLADWLK